MHFVWVGILKILHEPAQGCVGFVFAIDIDDVSHVVKLYAQLIDMPVNVVDGEAVSQHILCGNEDHICLWQVIEVIACFQMPQIQHINVVPGSLGSSSAADILHLKVVFVAVLVDGQYIEADTAPLTLPMPKGRGFLVR